MAENVPNPMPRQRDPARPTLYLMVGLPGAGKTTRAKEIEADHAALRLTPDEWILALFGPDLDRAQRDAVRDPVEALQWQVAKRVLRLGGNVVLDWGFWSRAERDHYRRQAEAVGAAVRVVFVDRPLDELWQRVSGRDESRTGTLQISRAELQAWARTFEPPTDDELNEP